MFEGSARMLNAHTVQGGGLGHLLAFIFLHEWDISAGVDMSAPSSPSSYLCEEQENKNKAATIPHGPVINPPWL